MSINLDTMRPEEWREVATLVHDSTNGWYERKFGHPIFANGPDSTLLFCEVYEALDPNCCLTARFESGGPIVGSCFFHPRETHYSLGIMNVHPHAFGRGVARALLARVLERADEDRLPVRLVSSAMNLDSFSLYTKAGFVPRCLFQDLVLEVPADGLPSLESIGIQVAGQLRSADAADVKQIGQLEFEVAGIQREKDYRYFINNALGCWNMSVLESGGELQGWIASVAHPGSKLIGPCVARNEQAAVTLLHRELNHRAGEEMVFLLPVEASELVSAAYQWGAKNCEIHVAQARGHWTPVNGIVMPTFMPETG